MNLEKLAKEFTNGAIKYFDKDNGVNKPTILMDKVEYKNIDIEKFKTELNKLNFDIIDLLDAPKPFDVYPMPFKKQKYLIFQK